MDKLKKKFCFDRTVWNPKSYTVEMNFVFDIVFRYPVDYI